MRKFFRIFFICILVIGIISCIAVVRWFRDHRFVTNGHDISLQIKESDEKYQIYAYYNRSRTDEVQQYLDSKLRTHLFRKSRINATITLEDDTRLYVKKTPGRLVIKFNRDENSVEAYRRMKELAEGLKVQITN